MNQLGFPEKLTSQRETSDTWRVTNYVLYMLVLCRHQKFVDSLKCYDSTKSGLHNVDKAILNLFWKSYDLTEKNPFINVDVKENVVKCTIKYLLFNYQIILLLVKYCLDIVYVTFFYESAFYYYPSVHYSVLVCKK